MSRELFRREVLEAKRTNWMGGISLATPSQFWLLTGFATFAALAVLLFLLFGTYARRTRVTGQLVPTKGLSTVLAPATGVVARVLAAEGERVDAGQELAVVSVPRATIGSGDIVSALQQRIDRRKRGLLDASAAQRQLLDEQARGLEAELASARRELAQVENEIAAREQQALISGETLGRLRRLQADRYVSDLQVKQQQAAHLQAMSDARAARRDAVVVRRNIARLGQSLAELPSQRLVARAERDRELATLEQEQLETEARASLAVSAPVDGMVATQLAKPGQAVQAGQPLAMVLPANALLQAELLVPGDAIGFIDRGDAVLLRYQAYPYQKFGHARGRVSDVGRHALSPGLVAALLGGAAPGEPRYRVTVELDRQTIAIYGKQEALRPGLAFQADVLGERRRLIEWILEPLYALKEGVAGS